MISNAPNPFKDLTTISFELAEKGEVVLKVVDLNGRTVLEKRTVGTSGLNEITINGTALNETGIYYYQIQTEQYTATKKLVFVD